LQVGGLGRFRQLPPALDRLSQLNVRIYLPAQTRSECAGIRALASLGFHCCVVVDPQRVTAVDWPALKDLAVYALYSTVPHGDIDPFSYIAEQHDGNEPIRATYFDDPSKFLHVDENARLSLSPNESVSGLDVPLERCDIVRDLDAYRDTVNAWKSTFFIQHTPCGQCEAWSVCRGAFAASSCKTGCRDVFREVLEGAEHIHRLRNGVKRTWRL
jgi:hypothetical protein